MVLPDRIELSTSPLPRECSTTELRQRADLAMGPRGRYTRRRRLTRRAASGTLLPMSETPRLTPARQAERAARDKRLAEALRANLRRRKEQARAREDTPPPAPEEDRK
jgi:hypothetical protein